MGTKGLETATSLERFLNRSVLFVQGIEASVPKSEVLQALSQVIKQPQQGRIDILTSGEGKMRGTAFLNFFNKEDAKAALEKWRFGLTLRGRHLRMQFSSDREFKEVIQGPLMARFKILIRNLPEEMDAEALYDKFVDYGEILQVHTAHDHYQQYYAIIQYVETAAVQSAIRSCNREKVFNQIITVEPYRPNATFGPLPKNINNPAGTGTSSAAGGGGGPSSRLGLGGSTPMTYAALQQQQEREAELMAGGDANDFGAAFAPGASRRVSEAGGSGGGATGAGPGADGGGGGGAGTTSGGGLSLQVPSYYAAAVGGAPHQGYASMAGSLGSLLATALKHVGDLDHMLLCPITQEPLVDPVVAADGNTYERIAIEAWFEKSDRSPLTNETLHHKSLTPNNLIRSIAEVLKGGTATSDSTAATTATTAATHVDISAADTYAAAVPLGNGAVPAAAPAAPEPDNSIPVPVPVPVPAGPTVNLYEDLHLQQEQQHQNQQQQQFYAIQQPYSQQVMALPPQQQQFNMVRQHQSAAQHVAQQAQHGGTHYIMAQPQALPAVQLRAQAPPFPFHLSALPVYNYRPV